MLAALAMLPGRRAAGCEHCREGGKWGKIYPLPRQMAGRTKSRRRELQ